MTPSEELDKMVNELDSKRAAPPQSPLQISVSVKEWSDLHRRNGYLEGVVAGLLGTDADYLVRSTWEYYQRVMLGLPVTVKED